MEGGGTISLNYIPVYDYTFTACILNQLVQHTRKSQGRKCITKKAWPSLTV